MRSKLKIPSEIKPPLTMYTLSENSHSSMWYLCQCSEEQQWKKMFEILVAIFTLILVFFITRYGFKPKKFPPGPPRIPFVGSLPLMPSEVKKGQKKFQTYMQEVHNSAFTYACIMQFFYS